MTATARFTIAIGRALGTVVVTIHGDLDMASAAHLESVLSDLISGQDEVALIIDLHDARVDDPEALSIFVRAAARAGSRAGTLVLCNPLDTLYPALEAAGLGRLVSVDPVRRVAAADGDHGSRSDHPAGGPSGRPPSGWAD